MAHRSKKEIMAGVDSVKSKVIDNNTVEYYRADGTKVIRLHLTDIITFNPDGSITLNTDGWTTVTTKARMNEYMSNGWHIDQDKSIWYLTRGNYWTDNSIEKHVYQDGITICADGSVKGAGEDPKKYIKLGKDINKYVKGFMADLTARKLNPPGNGDCWDCSFKSEDGRSMGEISKSNHILSHFEEKYYVPTLLFNAIERIPVSQAARHCIGYWTKMHDEPCGWFEDVGKEQITRSLRRYLKRQLGMAA